MAKRARNVNKGHSKYADSLMDAHKASKLRSEKLIAECLKEGWTDSEIASELGVSPYEVSRTRKRLGAKK